MCPWQPADSPVDTTDTMLPYYLIATWAKVCRWWDQNSNHTCWSWCHLYSVLQTRKQTCQYMVRDGASFFGGTCSWQWMCRRQWGRARIERRMAYHQDGWMAGWDSHVGYQWEVSGIRDTRHLLLDAQCVLRAVPAAEPQDGPPIALIHPTWPHMWGMCNVRAVASIPESEPVHILACSDTHACILLLTVPSQTARKCGSSSTASVSAHAKSARAMAQGQSLLSSLHPTNSHLVLENRQVASGPSLILQSPSCLSLSKLELSFPLSKSPETTEMLKYYEQPWCGIRQDDGPHCGKQCAEVVRATSAQSPPSPINRSINGQADGDEQLPSPATSKKKWKRTSEDTLVCLSLISYFVTHQIPTVARQSNAHDLCQRPLIDPLCQSPLMRTLQRRCPSPSQCPHPQFHLQRAARHVIDVCVYEQCAT